MPAALTSLVYQLVKKGSFILFNLVKIETTVGSQISGHHRGLKSVSAIN